MTPEIKQALARLRESGYGAYADAMEKSMTTTALPELARKLFEAYSRNSGNPPDCHHDRNAAEQWMAQAMEECGLASAEPVAWVDSGAFALFLNGPAFNGENFPISMRHAKFVGDIPLYTHAQPAAKAEAPSLDEVLATIRAYGEGCIRLGMESAPTPASDYPECSGDPASCPENEGHGCCKPNPVKTPASVPDYSYIIERIAASWDECMHVDSLDSVIDIGADIRDQWKRFVSDATNPAPASLEGFGPMPSPDLSGLTIRPTTPEPTP